MSRGVDDSRGSPQKAPISLNLLEASPVPASSPPKSSEQLTASPTKDAYPHSEPTSSGTSGSAADRDPSLLTCSEAGLPGDDELADIEKEQEQKVQELMGGRKRRKADYIEQSNVSEAVQDCSERLANFRWTNTVSLRFEEHKISDPG